MVKVHGIPAFDDNYLWLIQPDTSSNQAIIVDPGDAAPVIKSLTDLNLQLVGILLTHHHHDHIDGALELADRFSLAIHGPKSNRMPQVTCDVKDGDVFALAGLDIRVIALPGHTMDLTGYWVQDNNGITHLFSGDALFGAGCGRLFDGTAALHHESLKRISLFADDTIVYGAHEYTLANIEFALFIEPSNTELIARKEQEQKKRDQLLPTLPLDLGTEKKTNPFLRCHLPSIKARVASLCDKDLPTEADVFREMRIIKDRF